MFKVKCIDKEYIVYSVRYNEERGDELFLIYESDRWKWISSSLCEPMTNKEME